MLRFENVEVTYAGGTAAVQGVDLHIPRGEFCVVLGSSGAGKSTLLRTVNGLVRATSGTVDVDGLRVGTRTMRDVRAKVSMIHQSFNLVPRLSVLTNVLAGALQKVGWARSFLNLFPHDYRRKVCDLLAEVGMSEEQLYRRAGNLSGGQQQRVAIARAFILEPAVVLADEPVASLDPTTSVTVLSLLREAARRHNTTVMCSLHQVAYAREFADRIVGMKDGRVVFDGPPHDMHDGILRSIYGNKVNTALIESDRLHRVEDPVVAGARS
jgi:phosphonate transport system ATP-binding protein